MVAIRMAAAKKSADVPLTSDFIPFLLRAYLSVLLPGGFAYLVPEAIIVKL
jgi:hypothetical protein